MFFLYHRLSPLLKLIVANLGLSPGRCRFNPTCSQYTQVALARYGLLLGAWVSARRLLKCHPWSQGGFDPVP